MQITVKEQKGLEHSFNIVVPAADVEAQVENELRALGQKVKMQGFRPGKVPLNVLKQRYGKEVMGDVLEAAVNKATKELLEEKKLRPALQPDIAIISFEEGGDLSFDITMEVMPELPALDFEKITVDEYAYEIPDAELNESLTRLAKSRAHTHVKAKEAAIGDSVKIDFLGKIDGVAFDGGTASGFMLELGSNQFIEGFEQQLVGAKAGDKREVSVKFPENYHNAGLAGTPAVFDVTVHEVHEAHLPEIDDAFAASLGFKDLENLKGAVRQQIDFDYKGRARSKAKKQLFDALDNVVKLEVPSKMLAFENESIMKQVLEAKKQGDADLKDKSEDELKKEYGVIAERRVRLGIVLSEVARSNNLQITREELSAAVMSQARNYPGQEDKIFEFYRKNPREVEELRGPILEEKAVDFILGKVKRATKNVTIEELMKDDEEEAAPAKKSAKK
jgi:trigger factor